MNRQILLREGELSVFGEKMQPFGECSPVCESSESSESSEQIAIHSGLLSILSIFVIWKACGAIFSGS